MDDARPGGLGPGVGYSYEDWAGLPANVVLHIYSLMPDCRTAAAFKYACKSFADLCGAVDMLELRVVGDDAGAARALDASSGDIATWFGLDLDFAPMELVQQVGAAVRRRGAGLVAPRPNSAAGWERGGCHQQL